MGITLKRKSPLIQDPSDIFQREVKNHFEAVNSKPILDGVLIEAQAIATTTTKIAHTLGRIPRGFKVVDITANTNVFRDATQTNELSTYLYLKAGTATTVSLWVF